MASHSLTCAVFSILQWWYKRAKQAKGSELSWALSGTTWRKQEGARFFKEDYWINIKCKVVRGNNVEMRKIICA